MKNQDILYNNADSFAMIFDDAWQKSNIKDDDGLTIDEKIRKIIEENSDHPFIQSSPSQAFSVAKFRLRLLKIQ